MLPLYASVMHMPVYKTDLVSWIFFCVCTLGIPIQARNALLNVRLLLVLSYLSGHVLPSLSCYVLLFLSCLILLDLYPVLPVRPFLSCSPCPVLPVL